MFSYTSSVPRDGARLPDDGHGSIELYDFESLLCTLLDQFTQKLAADPEKQVVECYIAGGWVRDRLLGSSSNDIDIALSGMMGFPFASQFSEFLETRSPPILVTRVTRVKSRAEQSKHLETAKISVRLLDQNLDLDFVNLRSEAYANGSRIPTKVEFGTKLEDSLRRDLTINALLYNVHTRTVEDHTGKGIPDLRDGIIRTPLPPKRTFLDDPLRVLRCVRFASRYGFKIVPELVDAARDEEVQHALGAKISRDRIGKEIHEMMKGPDPLRAIELINSLCLNCSIFTPPPPTVMHMPTALSYRTAPIAALLLSQLLSASASSSLHSPHPSILSHTLSSASTRTRLYLACALTPFKGLTYTDEKAKKKSFVEACIRGLKLGVQDHFIDGIPPLFEAVPMLSRPTLDKYGKPSQRVALGLMLRDRRIHNADTGTHWTSSILFSLVQDLVPVWDVNDGGINVLAANEVIDAYNALVIRIEELDLPRTFGNPPLLNGREISALVSRKPGNWLRRALSDMINWQLDNPQSTREACAAWVQFSGVAETWRNNTNEVECPNHEKQVNRSPPLDAINDERHTFSEFEDSISR